MQQIIFFFIRNKNFLLFVLLFSASVALTLQTHSYHSNKLVNSANFLSGGVYSFKSSITEYFDLKEQNQLLINENNRLRQLLEVQKEIGSVTYLDSLDTSFPFHFVPAKVINNSYFKTKNKLTINKGRTDSLDIDMGVITSLGVVGIVDDVSANYATVQSILNTNSQINAKLKKSEHFGTLEWNTKTPNMVSLTYIPRIAKVSVGDTVSTGGKSTIFPEDILIGAVAQFTLNEGDDYYDITVELFNDMTNLKHVYVIENTNSEEIQLLENGGDDDAE